MNKRPCNFFAKGNCKKGNTCEFAHISGGGNMGEGGGGGSDRKPNKVCTFYAQGKCFKGDSCTFLHTNDGAMQLQGNPNFQQGIQGGGNPNFSGGGNQYQGGNPGYQPQENMNPMQGQQQKSRNPCRNFQNGKCDKGDDCNFTHRYSMMLSESTKVPLYQDGPILGICKTNTQLLITATDKKITIWELPLTIKDVKDLAGKVTNLLFSNSKLIASTQESLTFSVKSKVHIFCDEMTFSFETEAKNIFNILEIVKYVQIGEQKENISLIFIGGEGFIEVFGIRKNEIQKIINLKNDDKSDVLTLAYDETRSWLFAGHKSGCLSIWKLDDVNFSLLTINKMHDDAINKIILHKMNYVLTCSSDTKVKICDLANNGNIMELNLQTQIPVLDMFTSKNCENEDIFIFYFKNCDIVAYKEGQNGLERVFVVPGTQGSSRRFVVDFENPNRDKNNGEYILFTDGPFLDINSWEHQYQKNNFNQNKQGGNNNQGGNYYKPNNQFKNNKFDNNYGGHSGNRGKRFFPK